MKTALFIILMLIIAFLVLSANPVSAQHASGQGAGEPPMVQGVSDPAEVESFLDGLFSQQMADFHIAGITAVVVKDGRVIFQKGYGYSDLERKIQVEPSETIFRIGSITKLFTWTAVLQLVEQGKLDLDADINTYLDFQIPDTYPESITLKHLMSHTGGFEALEFELAAPSPDRIQPLGQYLAAHIPARVYPPGQVSSYSNYGTDLAGYIVERVSGMSYTDYIEANILDPLEMAHTTTQQPLPSGLAAAMSDGYMNAGDTLQAVEFELLSTQPCGAISSTAADMARFMLAHLQGGSLCPDNLQGNTTACVEILQEHTEQLMLSPLWGTSPRVTGFTHGFMELHHNGQRILYHPGDTIAFHSLLMLLPEANLGFFVSYNTGSELFWDRTLYEFMNHYYSLKRVVHQPAPASASRTESIAGGYQMVRSSYTTIEKVNNLLRWIVITPSEDGTLLLGSPLSPQKVRLEEVEPMLYEEATYGKQFLFQHDRQGTFTYLYDVSAPTNPFVKAPWHANPVLHLSLLGVCGLIFLTVLSVGLISAIIALFRRGDHAAQPGLGRIARWLSFLVALLDLSALVAFLVIYLDPLSFKWMIGLGQMSKINIILAIWLLAAVLTIVLAALTIMAWKKGLWNVASRVHYTLATLAALAFVWFLNYWNLLGFRY